MSDQRFKNRTWTCGDPGAERTSWEGAQLAVLMDIRDELQRLNGLLYCSNFIAIPTVLREIRKNTKKRARKANP